jgi:hypothetical protein
VDVAEQVFNGMVDPFTGEPIMVEPRHLIVTKQLEQTARRIISATEIRVIQSSAITEALQANPYSNKFDLVTSRQLAAQMATDTSWFLGDITKAFRYRVAEPINMQQAPAGNEAEFNRRIVSQFRVNERGAFYTVDPRFMVKSTVA